VYIDMEVFICVTYLRVVLANAAASVWRCVIALARTLISALEQRPFSLWRPGVGPGVRRTPAERCARPRPYQRTAKYIAMACPPGAGKLERCTPDPWRPGRLPLLVHPAGRVTSSSFATCCCGLPPDCARNRRAGKKFEVGTCSRIGCGIVTMSSPGGRRR